MDKGRLALNGNALKWIALLTMTIDHMGVLLFPHMVGLRYIGRVSFPIFAFMIAEGCFYTKNRKKYVGQLLALGLGCQAVYYILDKKLYFNILVTFSLSILLIYALDWAWTEQKQGHRGYRILAFLGIFTGIAVLCEGNWGLLAEVSVDYGLIGVLVPVFVFIGSKMADGSEQRKQYQLYGMGLGLTILSINWGGYQWICLLAMVLLMCYNGKRGRARLKYLFYIYYPLHMAVLWGIAALLYG